MLIQTCSSLNQEDWFAISLIQHKYLIYKVTPESLPRKLCIYKYQMCFTLAKLDPVRMYYIYSGCLEYVYTCEIFPVGFYSKHPTPPSSLSLSVSHSHPPLSPPMLPHPSFNPPHSLSLPLSLLASIPLIKHHETSPNR